MFGVKKIIKNIKDQQYQTTDRLNKKTTAFDKEWEKWGNKNLKTGKKLP
ncbi:hypothetical protein [Clostridium neonatale]|uniref:Uncharacterized protein n=1 Tax=Clostridium neonatale TaxID=137838 RepID=A0AAD1YA20_9CLOT|nr:hypothetical protein [Clostridium neonatale]CAI3192145.1 conserved hypothetical protein [Clostridium neonatale]CAI3192928.1 conserved hypothetical protein [Clostridium neonatale]CAI3196610.1 conserved hypothetical protein [Clostridium neonatale]CAI3216894.1 conserved hypothetical protein [Clostridium neonatale]CAI3218541.1 conserved hypothetical protein [Clostridium neonatale]